MTDSHDRDALRYTLDWVSSNGYPLTGSQVLINLLPITREHSDLPRREHELHDAARRICADSAALV